MKHPEDILIMLVIAIPVYFFWQWLYLKFIKDKLKRQFAIVTSTLIITPAIFWGGITLVLFCLFYYPTKDFDKKEWIANKEKRYQMSKNIVESKMLIGKTKAEVKAILGEQEHLNSGDKWYYYLEFLPGFAIDADHLYIQFSNGKVMKVVQVFG